MNYTKNTQNIVNANKFYFDSFWSKIGNGKFDLTFSLKDKIAAEAGLIKVDGCKNYFINITHELLYLIHEYLRIFLSDNQIFESIGVSSATFRVPEIRASSFKVLKRDIENSGVLTIFSEDREQLHYFMFGLITRFIMLHEFRHVINGHTDLIYECKYEEGEKLSYTDLQTLEMDAESCAIMDLFEEYMQPLNDNQYIPKQLSMSSENSRAYCLLFCHMLAMAVTSEHFMTTEKLENSAHPNPFMRHMIVLSTISTNYLDKPDIHANLMNIAVKVYKDFVEAHKRVIEDQGFYELEWTFNVDSSPYNRTTLIGKHWDNIRPRLEKYSMVPLPPLYNE